MRIFLQVSENMVEQRRLLQLQQDDGIFAQARNVTAAASAPIIPATAPTTPRALGSSDFDADFGEGRQAETGGSVYGGPSTVAQRVHALNGGLWGPNEEEEQEIALELARLREEVCACACVCVCVRCVGVCALVCCVCIAPYFFNLEFAPIRPSRVWRPHTPLVKQLCPQNIKYMCRPPPPLLFAQRNNLQCARHQKYEAPFLQLGAFEACAPSI